MAISTRLGEAQCQTFPMESEDPLQGHTINVISRDQHFSQKWTSTENNKAIEEYY